MTGYSWVKLPLKYRKDPRFQTSLDDGQKWRFWELYMLVHEYHSLNGEFVRNGEPLSIEEIAYEVHRDPGQVRSDMEIFLGLGLFSENGHGPFITSYKLDQEPVADKDRKQQERERKSQGSHGVVTHCDTESESDLKIESEDESSVIESSGTGEDPQTTDDRSKKMTDIFKIVGIQAKYWPQLLQDRYLSRDDILAELTRNYARKGKRSQGGVANPGLITAINLAKGERADASWYSPTEWSKHLPAAMLVKLGLPSRQDALLGKALEMSDHTQDNPEPEPEPDQLLPTSFPPVQTEEGRCWQQALEQLKIDMPKDSFDKWVRDTIPVGTLKDGVITVAASSEYACKWLQDRLASTVSRLLCGICNQPVKVRFVVKGSTA